MAVACACRGDVVAGADCMLSCYGAPFFACLQAAVLRTSAGPAGKRLSLKHCRQSCAAVNPKKLPPSAAAYRSVDVVGIQRPPLVSSGAIHAAASGRVPQLAPATPAPQPTTVVTAPAVVRPAAAIDGKSRPKSPHGERGDLAGNAQPEPWRDRTPPSASLTNGQAAPPWSCQLVDARASKPPIEQKNTCRFTAKAGAGRLYHQGAPPLRN